jgi:hypothetical protein
VYYFEPGVRVLSCDSYYGVEVLDFAEMVPTHRHANVAVCSVQLVNELDEATLRESRVSAAVVHLTHRTYQTQWFLEHESYVV